MKSYGYQIHLYSDEAEVVWRAEQAVREVASVGPHILGKYEFLETSAEVAANLNENTALNIPWMTDRKHLSDRLKLLMDKWEMLEVTRARESGGDVDLR